MDSSNAFYFHFTEERDHYIGLPCLIGDHDRALTESSEQVENKQSNGGCCISPLIASLITKLKNPILIRRSK